MIYLKKFKVLLILLLCFIGIGQYIYSHCQVPCGIYDDSARIKMIAEHIMTIEKAMKEVIEQSKKSPPNYNQIVRWIQNKEKHAEELSDILTYYFMAQRVKPVDKSDKSKYALYQKKLELLHHMLIYAMKAKQSTELENIVKLRELLKQFEDAYLKVK